MEIAVIMGAIFISIGVLMTLYGLFLFSNTKGSMYNYEDVDAMVAQTVKDEQEKMKKDEAFFEEYKPGERTYLKKGVLIA